MAEPIDSADETRCRSASSAAACQPDAVENLVAFAICDDFPQRPPVSPAELDVIERFFADILDAVLTEAGASTDARSQGVP